MATTNNATPFRRRLLKIAATATAAVPMGAATGAVRDAGADRELIALCAAWRRAFDRAMPVQNRLFGMHERDWTDEDRDLLDEVEGDVHELEGRVFGSKATTMAGIKAKAGVLDYLDAAAGIPTEREQAASLVADVLALGGAA